MKKTLLPLLALGLACCTPQRQDTQHITITTNDDAERKITLVPMGNRENSVDMTIEDGVYSATVNTSETGFYNLVAVKGSYQLIVPYYVPVNKGESTAHFTFGEVGVPSIESSKDNNALLAYTAAYADNSRALWKLAKGDTEAGRALLETYATMADSIIKAYRCSKPVAEYIRTWAYINACEGYNSLTRILGMPAKHMPFSLEELVPAAYTMLNSPIASLFPSTPGIIYTNIPNKNDLDSALIYVEQHYTDTTLLKKTKETIASVYVSRYNYGEDFEAGLSRLQAATERYGIDPRHAEEFAKHRSTIPGQPFPDGIILQDRDGNVVDFSAFRGKYVYIGSFGFHHNANQRLRSGRTHENAAFAAEVLLFLTHCAAQLITVHHGFFQPGLIVQLNIDENLRITRAYRCKLRGFLAAAAEDTKELQRCELSVTGSGIVGKDRVAGLLSADTIAVFQHLFQNISVTDRGADQTDIILVAELMQTKIAHDGSNDRTTGQSSLLLHVETADGHDLIAVNDLTALIDQQTAVSITVECNTEVILACCDHCRKAFEMCGTAVVVDVDAVASAPLIPSGWL